MSSLPVFNFHRGDSPLLVSMPHSGLAVPDDIRLILTPAAAELPDTDWFVDQLYDFLPELGASLIQANYSRYVVDLNRDPSGISLYPGQTVTELCPSRLFDGSPIYLPDQQPDESAVTDRIQAYWLPYHQKIKQELAAIREKFGYAILWDAHSINSTVPLFFEGTLPDFNWGTSDGLSCGRGLGNRLLTAMLEHGNYSSVLNGRFKGGYITRHFGDPVNNIHAVQLELSQATYLAEAPTKGRAYQLDDIKAARVRGLLKKLVQITLAHY